MNWIVLFIILIGFVLSLFIDKNKTQKSKVMRVCSVIILLVWFAIAIARKWNQGTDITLSVTIYLAFFFGCIYSFLKDKGTKN